MVDRKKIESLNNTLEEIETLLGENSYICGNGLTIADFCLAVITSTLEVVNYDLLKYPRTVVHLNQCKESIRGWNEVTFNQKFYAMSCLMSYVY